MPRQRIGDVTRLCYGGIGYISGGELGIISHVRERITHNDPSSGLTDVSLQVIKILE